MKRCLITERTCPKNFDVCCNECIEPCESKCTSMDCTAYVEMSTELVMFESKYLQALRQLVANEKQIKKLKEQQDAMKDSILSAMQKNGIKKFANEFVEITVVDSRVQNKFDSKALQQLEPEIYNKYLTASEVKAFVRINTK